MKHLFAPLFITGGLCAMGLGGYMVGAITGTPIVVDQKFNANQCTEIVVVPNYYTNKDDTVCEITLQDGTTLPRSNVAATFHGLSFPLQGN